MDSDDSAATVAGEKGNAPVLLAGAARPAAIDVGERERDAAAAGTVRDLHVERLRHQRGGVRIGDGDVVAQPPGRQTGAVGGLVLQYRPVAAVEVGVLRHDV